MSAAWPSSDIDLFTDASLLAPYENYRKLRDLGPVVWLERHEMFVMARYDDVRAALSLPEVFSSAHGVMMNERMNTLLRGITLCTDGEEHDVLRRIIMSRFPRSRCAVLRTASATRRMTWSIAWSTGSASTP